MLDRPLAATGLRATELGFGGGPIGNLRRSLSDAEAEATIDAAWQAGVRYFDTAPLYGHGLSERRLGRTLRHRDRSAFVLTTKVGRLLRPAAGPDFDHHGFVDIPQKEVHFDYSREGARRSIEASLGRLGLDRIDIALIHDIDHWTHGKRQPSLVREALDGAYRALADLKSEGSIAAIGIGLNESKAALAVARQVPLDIILLAGRYTLLERGAARPLLDHCSEHGIAVIIGGPFNSGILATGAVSGAWYDYAPAPPHVIERVRQIEATCARHGVPLPAAALCYPLRHPAVAAVIPGLMTPREVDQAASWISCPIPDALWQQLRAA